MTAKEKVLATWPDASAIQTVADAEHEPYWWIYCGNQLVGADEERLGQGETEEAAWQNAAESLPAEPEQKAICECGHPKHISVNGTQSCGLCCNEYGLGKRTMDQVCSRYRPASVEPVAPVEAKEKVVQQPIPCPTCKAPVFVRENDSIVAHDNGDGDRCAANETKMPYDCWKHEMQVCDICQWVAEPKPTPSTPTEPGKLTEAGKVWVELHRVFANLACSIFYEGYPEEKPVWFELDPHWENGFILKPQPDSSSIPDEMETDFVRDMRSYGAGEGDKHFGITRSEAKWIVENLKPARDSSYISTEQTFEEWLAKNKLRLRNDHFEGDRSEAMAHMFARAAWYDAKG